MIRFLIASQRIRDFDPRCRLGRVRTFYVGHELVGSGGLRGGRTEFPTDPLVFLMKDYQRTRVLTLLDPEKDPLGAGYHIIQSKIAIGSGGLEGKGWLQGTQSQLDFFRRTDFIFAVLAEEFGYLGIIALLFTYLLLVVA